MKSDKPNRISVLLLAVLLIGSLLLAGCDSAGAGAGTGDDPTNPGGGGDPSDVDFGATAAALAGIPSEVYAGISDYDGYVNFSLYYQTFFLGIFATFVDTWDGTQGTYTFGEYDVTAVSGDGYWEWSLDYDGTLLVYRAEATESGWTLTFSEDGTAVFSGTVSADGYSGSLELYVDSVTMYEIEWCPGGDYPLGFTISDYNSALPRVLVIETTLDGSEGFWNYTDQNDSNYDVEGFWPAAG